MSTFRFSRGHWTIGLSERGLRFLGHIAHRKTQLRSGRVTDAHKHRWFSFYIVENMHQLETSRGTVALPARALVIVFPTVMHRWMNREGTQDNTYVYDLTPLHGPHEIF